MSIDDYNAGAEAMRDNCIEYLRREGLWEAAGRLIALDLPEPRFEHIGQHPQRGIVPNEQDIDEDAELTRIAQEREHETPIPFSLDEPEEAKPAPFDDYAETGWAQAHRLALELECLIMEFGNRPEGAKWWDSAMAALSEHREISDKYHPQPYVSAMGRD